MNLADAMERAKVLDWNLQQQLRPYMEQMKPRPSVYLPDFIAANQSTRADNVMEGKKSFYLIFLKYDLIFCFVLRQLYAARFGVLLR